MPYKVMDVDGSEADDIISVLTKNISIKNIRLQKDMQPCEKVLVLSGDKDFIQLQKYPWLKQYNPILKKYICGIDPKEYLIEHVLKGDKSDGIPNYLSEDDTFVERKRQKPLSKKTLEKITKLSPEQFCNEEQLHFYNRNLTLIDFSYIPKEIEDSILDSYYSLIPAGSDQINKMYSYFMKHKLSSLIEKIEEF